MELRHLRYFAAVAEEGSMTRAADRLGIQQPPLGQQIRKLEQELGVELFERGPRHVRLNASGAFFLDEARAVLRMAEQARENVRRFDRGETGHVTIGLTSSASMHILTPNILRGFHQAYPKAELLVRESETYGLVLALQESSLDVAFLHIALERYPDLMSVALTEEQMMVAAPKGHPLERGPFPLDWPRLVEEPFVIYRRSDGPGIFDYILRRAETIGWRLNIVTEVTRLVAGVNLVAAGRGISIVPATMRTLHADAVSYLPLAASALPPLPLFVAHRRKVDLAIVRNFIAITHAEARRPCP
jgi:DNA-binding transcriptional LysR family regulator